MSGELVMENDKQLDFAGNIVVTFSPTFLAYTIDALIKTIKRDEDQYANSLDDDERGELMNDLGVYQSILEMLKTETDAYRKQRRRD